MKQFWCSLALVIFTFVAAGCGGGTSGTGDPSPRVLITGNVLLQNGSPVGSGNVAVVENGDTTNIAADGTFTLDTTAQTDSLELDVSTDVAQGRVVIRGLSQTNSAISITIVVDPGTGLVTLSDVDITIGGNPNVTENPTLRVLGTVEGEDTRGISGIVVELANASDTTDKLGYFQFEPIAAQSSIELVLRPGGGPDRISVRIDGLSTIQSTTAEIRLRVLGLQNGSGFPVDGVALSAEVAAVSISPGN